MLEQALERRSLLQEQMIGVAHADAGRHGYVAATQRALGKIGFDRPAKPQQCRGRCRRQLGAAPGDFRQRQRESALETVKSTLVLDEIARRESIAATDDDLNAEIAKFADRASRTVTAVRAQLEKDGAVPRLLAGIRREKTMTWLLEHAQISS